MSARKALWEALKRAAGMAVRDTVMKSRLPEEEEEEEEAMACYARVAAARASSPDE